MRTKTVTEILDAMEVMVALLIGCKVEYWNCRRQTWVRLDTQDRALEKALELVGKAPCPWVFRLEEPPVSDGGLDVISCVARRLTTLGFCPGDMLPVDPAVAGRDRADALARVRELDAELGALRQETDEIIDDLRAQNHNLSVAATESAKAADENAARAAESTKFREFVVQMRADIWPLRWALIGAGVCCGHAYPAQKLLATAAKWVQEAASANRAWAESAKLSIAERAKDQEEITKLKDELAQVRAALEEYRGCCL